MTKQFIIHTSANLKCRKLPKFKNGSPQKNSFVTINDKLNLEEEKKYPDFDKNCPKRGNKRNRGGHYSQDEKRRHDVVNKIIIRSIRRFYLKLFKSENLNVVK